MAATSRRCCSSQPLSYLLLVACFASANSVGISGHRGVMQWEYKKDSGMLKYKGHSAYCASVRQGDMQDGSDIILWHCDKKVAEMQWTFDEKESRIRARSNPKLCMTVREGRVGDGADLILWTCSQDADGMHFDKFIMEGEHLKYKAEPLYWVSVRAEAPQDGADLIMWKGRSAGYQWIVKGNQIKVKEDTTKCLAVEEGRAGDGANIVINTCSDGKAASNDPSMRTGQTGGDLWEVKGEKIVYQPDPKYCLGVRQEWIKDGLDIILWTCADAAEGQKWRVASEHIRLKNGPDYCLSLSENKNHIGSRAVVWNCDSPPEDGFQVTHEKGYRAHTVNEFKWVFDGNLLRSKAGEMYCASVMQNKFQNGFPISIWHCPKKERSTTAEEYQWQMVGDQIQSKSNPKFCMAVREAKSFDGANVILWECANTPDFRWSMEGDDIFYKADPKYQLSVRGGQIMDGTDLILWTGTGLAYKFHLENSRIKLTGDPTMCVSAGSEPGDGSNIVLTSCDAASLWRMDGKHLVLDSNSGKYCVDAREASHVDGTDLILWTCAPAIGGFEVLDGRFRFNLHKGKCMSLKDGRATDGQKLGVWACDVGHAQDDADDEL